MQFKKINQYKNKLIFDNRDDDYYDFIVQFEDQARIKLSDFKGLYLIERIIGEKELYLLVKQIDGAKENPLMPKAFSTENKLGLFFHIKENNEKRRIYLISTGETQPGRYKIFLEGIWEVIE